MRSSRSRVWRAPGRANPTASVRTPCSGQVSRRRRARSSGLPGAEIEVTPAALHRPGVVGPRSLEAAERAAQPAAAEGHGDHHTGGGELDLADPDARQVQQARECSGGAHRCPPGGSVEAFRRVRHRSRHTPRRPGGRTPPPELGTTSGAGRLPTRRPPTWRSRQHHPTGTPIYADRPGECVSPSPATSPIDATTAHHADRHQGGDRLASLVGEHRALRDLVSRLASGRESVANAATRRGSRARQRHGSRVSASQWRGRTAPK